MTSYKEITTLQNGKAPVSPGTSITKQTKIDHMAPLTDQRVSKSGGIPSLPDLYTDKCKLYQNRADLHQIFWAWPTGNKRKYKDKEQWESALLSSDPEEQLRAIQQAEDAAGTQGLLAAI